MSYHTFDELDGSYPNLREGFIPNYLLPDYRVISTHVDSFGNQIIVKKLSENILPFSKPQEEYLKGSWLQFGDGVHGQRNDRVYGVHGERNDGVYGERNDGVHGVHGERKRLVQFNGPHSIRNPELSHNLSLDKRYSGMY